MENPNHHQDIVVGLDIGTTKIACIVGQKNTHGKLEIIGYGKSESIGVTRGVAGCAPWRRHAWGSAPGTSIRDPR